MLASIPLATVQANISPLGHKEQIQDLVKQVLHESKVDSITPLSGGYSSPGLYKISAAGKHYVVRFSNDLWEPHDRVREIDAMVLASNRGLAPKIFYADRQTGIILMEFLPKNKVVRWHNLDDSYIHQLALRMRYLHEGPAFKDYSSIFDSVREMGAELEDDRLNYVERALNLNDMLEAELKPDMLNKPCHNDLHPDNTIEFGDQIYFIDWEEAGPGDPFRDLATYAIFAAMTPAHEKTLLKAYLDRLPTEKELLKYYRLKRTVIVYFGLAMLMLGQRQGLALPTEEEILRYPNLKDVDLKTYFADGSPQAIQKLGFIFLSEAIESLPFLTI